MPNHSKLPLIYISKHHIKPRKEGGTNEKRNLMNVCIDCHNKIEGMTWGEIMRIKKDYSFKEITK